MKQVFCGSQASGKDSAKGSCAAAGADKRSSKYRIFRAVLAVRMMPLRQSAVDELPRLQAMAREASTTAGP
ncbi:MAG: hypothetical protein MUE84_07095, partial [Hyphomonas sp.]|nr:hypothetical protein [Hyphomonas sp.]